MTDRLSRMFMTTIRINPFEFMTKIGCLQVSEVTLFNDCILVNENG